MTIANCLRGAAIAVTGALNALPVQAETMMLGHGFSPSHFFSKEFSEPWMTCVTDTTDGGLSFQYFPAGQVSDADTTLDALNTGLLQVASVSIGYVTNKVAAERGLDAPEPRRKRGPDGHRISSRPGDPAAG